MTKIKENLGLGSSIINLTITKKSEINTLITMLKDKLIGAKRLDFEYFMKIQDIINNGLHKTEEGLNQIRMIKKNMNRGRNDEK